MSVEVQIGSLGLVVPKAQQIKVWAEDTLSFFSKVLEESSLCIRLVDTEESKILNSKFRGQDRATNVLSFPEDVIIDGSRLLGDIVICVPVVINEARESIKNIEDHFAHMVVHGVLHLLGFVHDSEAKATEMEGIEREVLLHFGISNPYMIDD